jgi:hypothetical protein
MVFSISKFKIQFQSRNVGTISNFNLRVIVKLYDNTIDKYGNPINKYGNKNDKYSHTIDKYGNTINK